MTDERLAEIKRLWIDEGWAHDRDITEVFDALFVDRNRIAELEAIGDSTCENCAKLEDDVDRLRESEKFFSEKCGDAELKVLELEATIEKVEALIPDWREYALDGTLGSSAVDCADDLEVALGDKV